MGWVFGVSMFSLKGEHIGWFEDGVMYDIQNNVLGFIPGAKGLALEMPALGPEPVMPALSKRPYVPGLRGRAARPRGTGWSASCLASYLEQRPLPADCPAFMARAGGMALGASDLSH